MLSSDALIKYVYQPICKVAAKYFGIISYRLGQHCAEISIVMWLAFEMLEWPRHSTSVRSLESILTVGWLFFMYSYWREGARLYTALMAGRPALCAFSDNKELLARGWIICTLIDIILFEPLGVAIDIMALSTVLFLCCDPVLPKKREQPINAVMQGASP